MFKRADRWHHKNQLMFSMNTEWKDLSDRSTLYREFMAERDEILRHKWIESEKAEQDIGYEQARIGWVIKHRPGWRRMRQEPETKSNPE